MNQILSLNAGLGALVIRADGSHRDITNLSCDTLYISRQLARIRELERQKLCIGMDSDLRHIKGLVTTAGVNYLAADFLAASSARINAFQYADCGTSSTAATIAQTALVSAAGTSRVSGTGSNPVSGTFQNVATIPFTGTLTITEYGLFSASTSGTMWDRRVFTGITVNNGDTIQFTYAVVINAGGS
jgi:hypothetical protein